MLLGSQPGAAALAHPWWQGRVQFPSRSPLLSFGAEPAPLWEAGMLSRPAGGKDRSSALCAVAQTPAPAPGGLCWRPRRVPAVTGLPPPRRPVARARGTLPPGSGTAGGAASGRRSASPCWRFGGTVLAPQAAEWLRGLAERWPSPHTSWRRRGASRARRALPSRAGPAGPRPRFRARPRHTRAGPGTARAGEPGAPSGGGGAGPFAGGTRRGGSKAERGAARLLPWAPG